MRATIHIADLYELWRRINEEIGLYGPKCDLNRLDVTPS